MHEIIFGRGSTVLPEILIRKRDHSTRKYERGGVRSKGKIERGRGVRGTINVVKHCCRSYIRPIQNQNLINL
jgi:hypothetical protein